MQTQLAEQTPQSQIDAQHSIHLVTTEMNGPGGPAYNYILFRDHNGEDKVMMNGLALERQKSKIRALRGVMAPPNPDSLPQDFFNEIVQIELFRGSVEHYLQKMAMAVEALEFINAQNLNYRPEDIYGDSPNSVTHTLVKAMGLDFPEEATHFWAPGHDNIVLPKGWRSKYEH